MAGFLRLLWQSRSIMKKIRYLVAGLFLVSILSAFTANLPDEDPLSVFPNPAKEKVSIQLDIHNTNATPEIDILDLTGKSVKTIREKFAIENEQYKMRLDISDLKPGIYFVKVKSGQDTFSKKLLVR